MRKILLTLCLIAVAILAKAAKANPRPFVVTQPDGTQVTLIMRGDEHFSWISTLDGTIVTQVNKGYYVAKIDENGNIIASEILAHDVEKRSVAEQKLAKAQAKDLFFGVAESRLHKARRTPPIGKATPPYFPHLNSPKILVILVDFDDVPFKLDNVRKSYDQYLNKEGEMEDFGNSDNKNYGSVRNYFKFVSGGKFTPEFKLYGPVRMPKDQSYYGADENGRKDVHYREMVKDAVKLVAAEVNPKEFDSNSDGKIDLVYIIYSGYAQSWGGNDSKTLWPKSFYMTASDNVKIGDYLVGRLGISNELGGTPAKMGKNGKPEINGIGLFCHEFSHTMGLPDIYPTRPVDNPDDQGMECWDIMDGGEYTANGYCPTPYTPWEREAMGWTRMEPLEDIPQKVTLKADEFRKITTPMGEKEYVVVHNIQNVDWYAGVVKYFGHGMLVYRINYNYNFINMYDPVNNTSGRPGVTIIPADGKLLSQSSVDGKKVKFKDWLESHRNDVYPGPLKVTEITTMKLNLQTITDKPIYNIKEDVTAKTIMFDFIEKQNADSISAITNLQTPTDDKIFTIDGRFVGIDKTMLPKGVYIQGGKKFVK
ncbi:M6 family metalloprotease domain-containing protein [Prevotella disiens]